MTKKRFDFWSFVEELRGARSKNAFFRKQRAEDIRAFMSGMNRQMARARRWDVWAVGAIASGLLATDFFRGYQGWLVLQGRDFFEGVLREPERAAGRMRPEDSSTKFEDLGEAWRAAHEAYERKTGREIRGTQDPEPAPRGTRWTWRRLKRLHPRIWDVFFVRRDRKASWPRLRTIEDDDLVWHAADPVRNWADIYSDPSYLREQYRLLNPSQRALHSVLWMHNEADNGGIDQFFWNSTGVVAPEALLGLKLIGADDHHRELKRIMRAFPGGAPDSVKQRRRRQIWKRWRSAEKRIDDEFPGTGLKTDLDEALASYIRKHPGDFFRPKP